MKVFTATVLAVLLAALTVPLAANDKARELKLQQAIDLIESKGDLTKATPLFEDVATSTDRTLAVRGLLHLAQAQERFGKGNALATYQRIVNSFGGANEPAAVAAAAAEARAKLASVGQKIDGLVAREVWDQTADFVSPDGSYVTFVDWANSGNLMARDLASGRVRRLTNNAQLNGNLPNVGVPSTDGKRVAFGWYDPAGKVAELRVIGRDGGRAEGIFVSPDPTGNLLPWGWTHDDRWILATVGTWSARSACNLVLIPVAGGSPRQIKRFDNCYARNFRLSPDDKSVAFDRPAMPGSPRRGVFWLSLEQAVEQPLLADGANETILGWFPTGDRILFASDRKGSNGIWATRVAGGRAAGEPVLVRKENGTVQSLGFTKRGDFYYTIRESESEVQVAELDPETGRQIGSLSRLKSRFVGLKLQAAWSPSGDRIAFVQTPVTNPTGPVRDLKLAIQDMATAEVRLLPLPLQNMQFPAWLPDGRAIIIQGRDSGARQGLHRVNLETGTLTTIAAREPDTDVNRGLPAPARHGERLFFRWTSATSPIDGVAVRDLSSNIERRITKSAGSFALSPNDEWLAINEVLPDAESNRRLSVIPSSGGEPRALSPSVAQWAIRGPVAWSADSRFVFVVRAGDRFEEVWQVPIDGSAPRDTGVRWAGSILRISAHPDGSRLALSTLGTSLTTWVLQNIPPQR